MSRPDSAALPPEPWRAVYFDHTREIALWDAGGNNILRMDSPEIHALLIGAPRTARRLARLETVLADWGLDDPLVQRAAETGGDLIVTAAQARALRAALEDEHMTHLERTLTAAAAIQREADAGGVGRISAADREAATHFGMMIADWIRRNWVGEARRISAEENAKRARATGCGFGLALAEWLERWAGEEGG